jgi:protein kinase A
MSKKSITSVMNERIILQKLKDPFIVNLAYAFQDRENLYIVADFMAGGDLRYNLQRKKTFNEEETKFIMA